MKICIDAGHGMSNRTPNVYDPGAVHREDGLLYREADIVLVYAKDLAAELTLQGREVFLSRSKFNDAAPVGKRVAAASAAGCSMLVSLHLNDFDDDQANGIETLYGSPDSRLLAEWLQRKLARETGLRDRGAKMRTDLAVLRFPGKSILVELGFIANDGDRTKILDPEMRTRIVQCIAQALLYNP